MSTKIASLYAEIGAKTEGFEQGSKRVKSGMGDLKATWISAAATFAIVGRELQKDIMAASDLAESTSKVGVVFGESADEVERWSSTTANGLGISQQAALEAAGTYGNLFTALGLTQTAAADMSTEMVQLAADLASFNNQNPEDVLMALRSGLSGEVEPLKRFGIAMNQATLSAKAMELGLGNNIQQLTEAEKVQVRYAVILDQTTTAQGDFDRTSEGLANTMRQLKANTEDLRAGLGQAFEPTVTEVINVVNELTTSLSSAVKAENILLQAVDDGIITQEEANKQINKFTWTSYTAADATEWLDQKVEENIATFESYDRNLLKSVQSTEELTAAASRLSESYDEQLSLAEKLMDSSDEQTAKIVYNNLLQKISVDGITDAEYEMASAAGVALGIYSTDALDAARNVDILTDAVINGSLAADNLNAALSNLPRNIPIDIQLNLAGAGVSYLGNGIYSQNGSKQKGPGFATGGSFIVPKSFGYEGFNLGGVATASGGERITVSKDSNSNDNNGIVSLDEQSLRLIATTIVKTMQAG